MLFDIQYQYMLVCIESGGATNPAANCSPDTPRLHEYPRQDINDNIAIATNELIKVFFILEYILIYVNN